MRITYFPKEHIPFAPLALQEQGISDYEVKSSGTVLVPDKISNRKLKVCRRRAWAFYMSNATGVRYLTREDAGKTISGVVPESEKRFFKN